MLQFDVVIEFIDNTVKNFKTCDNFIMSKELIEESTYSDAVTKWACRLFNLPRDRIVTAKVFEVSQ